MPGTAENNADDLSFENVPFFMSHVPDSIEGNTVLEALHSLIYDDPPVEIARNFYTQAYEILSALPDEKNSVYIHNALSFLDKACEQKYDDNELSNEIILLRAYAHMQLQNYGRAFKLVEKLKESEYEKENPLAILKSSFLIGFQALLALKKYEALIDWAKGVQLDATLQEHVDRAASDIATKRRKVEEEAARSSQLSQVLRSLNITLQAHPCDPFRDMCSELTFGIVEDQLSFPICLLYPPYNTCDFVESCLVSQSVEHILTGMMPFPCDKENLYDNRSTLYYVDLEQPNSLRRVDKMLPLYKLFTQAGFRWSLPMNGRLTFALLPKGKDLFGFTVLP